MTIHDNLPDGVPPELHWLFTEAQPGRRINYSFRCPYGAAIHRHHAELDAVVKYERALRVYIQDAARAPRTSKLGAKRVLTLKNAMVKAVVRHYGGIELDSKEYLRRCIGVLQSELRQSLEQTENAIYRVADMTGLSGEKLHRFLMTGER